MGVTVCNIELQNEANFSYCMHFINPLFSIVISTTITITAITITTITITSIGYFTHPLSFNEPYITPLYQRSLIHHYQLAPSEARFTPTGEARSTATSLLPAKPHCQRGESDHSTLPSLLPAKPGPPLPGCSL